MKALVTGGAGFIGSHIADALLGRGYEVRALDNLEPRVHPRGCPGYLDGRMQVLKGDMRDRAAMESALDGVDVVFHMADYQGNGADYAKFFHSNVVGTALLFEIIEARRLPVRKVVIASSQAVYGEGQYYCATHGLVLPDARPVEQLDRAEWEIPCAQCHGALVAVLLREGRANPASPYGISKLAQENAAFHLGKLLGIPVVALRYSNVEGPRQSSYNGAPGICGSFTHALQQGHPFAMLEDGKQLRDYVHVSDAVEASLLAMEDARADGQVFNVGTGRGITVVDFVRVLTQKTKAQISPEVSGAYRLGDARHAISSIARLQGLGWKPKKGLGEIFDDYVEWLASATGRRDSAAAGAGSPLESLETHALEKKLPAEVPVAAG